MDSSQPHDALTIAALKLHATQAPWMVTGSTAALFWGRIRTTIDIDIVVDFRKVDPDHFALAFAPEYMLHAEMIRDTMRTGIMANALPLEGGPKLDLIPLKANDDFQLSAFERRIPLDWMGVPIFAASPEDVILNKLLWGRASDSQRQLADVQAIMAENDDLELDYIQRWASQLNLEQELEAARTTRHDS